MVFVLFGYVVKVIVSHNDPVNICDVCNLCVLPGNCQIQACVVCVEWPMPCGGMCCVCRVVHAMWGHVLCV